MADSFHKAAVADDGIGHVVDQLIPEARAERFFRDGQTDGIRQTLAERAGRRLDPGFGHDFGMPGRDGMQLAKTLDLVHAAVLVSRQAKRCVQKH